MTKDTPGTVEAVIDGLRAAYRDMTPGRIDRGGCDLDGHAFAIEAAIKLLSASPPVWQPIETALREHEARQSDCPFNGPRPPARSEACPRCYARASSPCGVSLSADYTFIETVRALLPAPPVTGGE